MRPSRILCAIACRGGELGHHDQRNIIIAQRLGVDFAWARALAIILLLKAKMRLVVMHSVALVSPHRNRAEV